jgi:hypothetical protein
MYTYKTERENTINFIINHLLIQLIATAIFLFIFYLFKKEIPEVVFWIIPIFIVTFIFREIFKQRLIELTFDTENKYIHFTLKNLFSKPEEKIIRFENVKLNVFGRKAKMDIPGKVTSIYFHKKKLQVFELNKYKDGFSYETMSQIVATAEELSLPVI